MIDIQETFMKIDDDLELLSNYLQDNTDLSFIRRLVELEKYEDKLISVVEEFDLLNDRVQYLQDILDENKIKY